MERTTRVASWLIILGAVGRPALADIPVMNCGEDFVPTVRDAALNARGLALRAQNYMTNEVDKNPGPYESYFGRLGDTAVAGVPRRDFVANKVTAINRLLASDDFVVRCDDPAAQCDTSPDKPPYAYSDRTDTQHRIFVCPENFKTIIAMGHNSQAGVFVHEASHFVDVASTDDAVDCETVQKCLALGSSEPNTAMRNADSYQYFEEEVSLPPGCGSTSTRGGCSVSGRSNANIGTLLCVLGAVLLVRRRRAPSLAPLAVLLCVAAGCAGTGLRAAHPAFTREHRLTCSLSVAPVVARGTPVEVWFALTNVSDETMHVYTWSTPFVPNDSGYMTLRRGDGSDVPGHGWIVERLRRPPPPGEYIIIEPGKKAAGMVDLARNFDMPPGEYEAEFRNALQDAYGDVRERQGLRYVTLDCNRVWFRVE